MAGKAAEDDGPGEHEDGFDVEQDEEHGDHVEADGEAAAGVADGVHAALVGAELGARVLVLADEEGCRHHAAGQAEGDKDLQHQRKVVPDVGVLSAWPVLSVGVGGQESRIGAGAI